MRADEVDAVVIGAGPNGLVAANLLADAGWEVLVLEASGSPGGAVRTAELIEPGFHHDVCSAFYPFAAASPAIRGLHLEDHGLVWRHTDAIVAHPTPAGPTAVMALDPAGTSASMDAFAAGDGARWAELFAPFDRLGDALVDALLTPFPPVWATARLAAKLGPAGARDFVRFGLLSAQRMSEEHFEGDGGPLLLTGLAMHADLGPDAAASGFFGWLLAAIGQKHGFPVPEGGAGRLIDAMVARLESRGGRVLCGARVDDIVIEGGRAVGVAVDGAHHRARRGVLADVGAPALYGQLVGYDRLPSSMRDRMRRFQPGAATFKVDWSLDGPIPWKDEAPGAAGTVHIADSVDELAQFAYHLGAHQLPSHPFLLMGQMTTVDPTRSPGGTETAWAYTHVPQRVEGDAAGQLGPGWGGDATAVFAERIEARIEAHAPGFRDRIRGRHVLTPPDFEALDANLTGGDTNGGTAQLHQQLIFRPIPGLGRAETPVPGLFLASASAHPGGGVHGAPGSNAARAAIAHDRVRRARASVAAGARRLVLRPRPAQPQPPGSPR